MEKLVKPNLKLVHSLSPEHQPEIKGLIDVIKFIIFDSSNKKIYIIKKCQKQENMKTTTKTAPEALDVTVEAPKHLNKKERIAAKRAKRIAAELEAKAIEDGKALRAAEEAGKKKKKNVETPTSKTLTDANAVNVIAKITVEKDLKYIYPEDCEEGGSKEELLERRKKFRAGVRRKVASYEHAIQKLMEAKEPDQKEIDKAEKAYRKYAKTVYNKTELVPVS